MFVPDKFPRLPIRRRLLLALLAVAVAAFVTWSVTRKSGVIRDARLHPADVAACTSGQTEGCVGSKTEVIALPVEVPLQAPVQAPVKAPASSASR